MIGARIAPARGWLRKLRALTSFSSANWYQSAGGEPGDTAGHGGAVFCRLRLPSASATRTLASKYVTTPGNAGYYLATGTLHAELRLEMASGAGAWTAAVQSRPQLERLAVFVYQHTGAGAQLKLWATPDYVVTTAITGYTVPAAALQYIGRATFNGSPAIDTEILSEVTWRGVPTDAAVRDYYLRARALDDLPTSLAGVTFTSKWPDRALLKPLTAPATIPDVVTSAPANEMARNGSPAVTEIDVVRRDGRRSLGVHGFGGGANYLYTAGGIRGAATGLTLLVPVRIDALPTGTSSRTLVNTYPGATPTTGYSLYGYNGALNVYVPSTSTNRVLYTPNTADVGHIRLLAVTWDGSTWRGYVDAVQTMADSAGAFTAGAGGMYLGRSGDPTAIAANDFASLFGAAGCDQALTLAELQQVQRDFVETGKVVLPAGKINPHSYDFTSDCLPTESVPAQLLDRAGTDHLARIGIHVGPNNQVRRYSAADYLRTRTTQLGGSLSGFWVEMLVDREVDTTALIAACGPYLEGSGWTMRPWGGVGNLTMRLALARAGGAITLFGPLPVGMHHIAFSYDGSVARLYSDGVLTQTSAAFTYVPETTEALMVGAVNSASGPRDPYSSGIYGIAGGHSLVSDAEIATAAAAALAQKRVVGIAGKTDRRFSLVDDVAEAGGALPASYRDRASSSESLVRMGAPLQLAQRTDRAWTYERTPVVTGVTTFSLADHLAHPDAFRVPDNTDWSFLLYWSVDSQVGATPRVLIGDLEGNPSTTHGFSLYTSGANASLILQAVNAAGTIITAPFVTIAAADLGKMLVSGGTFEAATGRLRMFHKRLEAGTGASCVGYRAPTAGGMSWIGRAAPGQPATGTSVFGWSFAPSIMTLAEYQAAHDAVAAREDIVSVPGKSRGLWSLKQDRIDQVALIADRLGNKPFPRVGAPALSSRLAHSWAA